MHIPHLAFFFSAAVVALPGSAPILRDILPTVVFTPGAWHETWAFDTVRDNLSLLGYESVAVPLPSVGTTNASVGLVDDVAALRTELEALVAEGKDLVMVVHSYGGLVGSNAVEGLDYKTRAAAGQSGGVIMLVYMTAFAAPANSSLMDALGGNPLPWFEYTDDGNFLTAGDAKEIFYADVEESLAEEAIAALKSEPARIMTDDSHYEPWSNGVEVGFFFTLQDQAIPISTQQSMASQFPDDSFTYTMNSSHSPFLSMPETVASAIVLASTDAVAKKVL